MIKFIDKIKNLYVFTLSQLYKTRATIIGIIRSLKSHIASLEVVFAPLNFATPPGRVALKIFKSPLPRKILLPDEFLKICLPPPKT